MSNPDDNGNGNSHQDRIIENPSNLRNDDGGENSLNPVESSSSNSDINQNNNQVVSVPQDQDPESAMDESNPNPDPNPNAIDLDINIELMNREVLDPRLDIDFDREQEEFRRRFYEVISRRNSQPVESPPEYEEVRI